MVKQKYKKAEKDAIRELKKDTATIMAEKARMQKQRKSTVKIYKGGNGPKDDV